MVKKDERFVRGLTGNASDELNTGLFMSPRWSRTCSELPDVWTGHAPKRPNSPNFTAASVCKKLPGPEVSNQGNPPGRVNLRV